MNDYKFPSTIEERVSIRMKEHLEARIKRGHNEKDENGIAVSDSVQRFLDKNFENFTRRIETQRERENNPTEERELGSGIIK